MTDIVLKNQLLGYHFTNASKQDKQIFIVFQISSTEGYIFNIVFPKCAISYIFLFRNPDDDNKVYLAGKAADNLTDAMDQPFFNDRIPLEIIVTLDLTQKSINFVTADLQDQTFSNPLFDPNCIPTPAENHFEAVVRQAVIDKNASAKYQIFGVDRIITAPLTFALLDQIRALGVSSVKVTITRNGVAEASTTDEPFSMAAGLENELSFNSEGIDFITIEFS